MENASVMIFNVIIYIVVLLYLMMVQLNYYSGAYLSLHYSVWFVIRNLSARNS